MKRILTAIIFISAVCRSAAFAQTERGSSGAENTDSLSAAVFTDSQKGNYLSKGKELRVEVISSAGLQKMACCNLAESFENSASVTVGYSDAVTGARQIRLLGLSGIYTQMLDENRPVMRGLASPFGLTYMPGQWLESIQIAKGASSVINGTESMTGQINLEHRKPTDEKPLFISLTGMNDTRVNFDIASSLQFGEKWSTVILGHTDGNFKSFDMNHDGFMDDPKTLQFNLSNRWLYYDPRIQIRFGVMAVQDRRTGGQEGYDRSTYTLAHSNPWGTDITNRSLGGYFKAGIPLREDQSSSIALVADWTRHETDSWFGATSYSGRQNSGFLNLLYRNRINDSHDITAGFGGIIDMYDENMDRKTMAGERAFDSETVLGNAGFFGEYTFHAEDKLSAIAGLRAEWFKGAGMRVSPRITIKYQPAEEIVARLNAGRGLRHSIPLIDNIGVFSTGKELLGDIENHLLEDAWTMGGNITFYLPIGANKDNSYISFDWFRTQFAEQMVVDYEHIANAIEFYGLGGKRSYTNSYQADFAVEPLRNLTVNLTARYTDARIELEGRGLTERPMTNRFKGVLNLQYKTNLSRWIFDFTASLNGTSRVYDFMRTLTDENGDLLYPDGRTPAYPMLYAQITRRFRGVDVYIGGENLTGYRQKHVILGTKGADGHVDARVPSFDASAVWGPLMGLRLDAGIRVTLWKTRK